MLIQDAFSLQGLAYALPVLAFAAIALFALVVPALHIVFVFGRALGGRHPDVNPWILWRILPFLLTLAALVPLTLMAQAWQADSQFAYGQLAVLALVLTGVMIPIALPLFQAYQEGASEVGLYLFAILAFLALPVAATIATGLVFDISHRVAARSAGGDSAFASLSPAFSIEAATSPCSLAMEGILGRSEVSTTPGAQPGPYYDLATYRFWVDMTLKAAFLDFFEAYDCTTTNLRHNPANVMMASLVFIYRAFVQLIVLVAVAYPFTRRRPE